MEVVPIENESAYKDNVVAFDDVNVEYLQTADCNSKNDAIQMLKVWTENNGMERYICIKTDRWAISNIDDMVKVLKDFMAKARITEAKNDN